MKVTVDYLQGADGQTVPSETYENVAGISVAPGLIQLVNADGRPIALVSQMAVRRVFSPENDSKVTVL